MTDDGLEIAGRLLRAGTNGFVAGCSVSQLKAPSFGALVRVPLDENLQVYGLIHDIRIDDDGLVRQLVTTSEVDEATVADNRLNRIVPVEMSVLTVGYEEEGKVWHLLPPRPPLSLDVIYLCSRAETLKFTGAGRFGYFRHILQAKEVRIGELLAAHIRQVSRSTQDKKWATAATQELITLLRDDYPTLMSVLGALSDALPD